MNERYPLISQNRSYHKLEKVHLCI